MANSPGIVLSAKFARPTSSVFQSYLDYMDREEAVRNETYNQSSAFISTDETSVVYEGDEEETLEGYIHYLKNPIKTSHLFSMESNDLDEADIHELKHQFMKAANNGSVMWQDVFSFNNDWLVAHNYLNAETNELDEKKIKQATRFGMVAMLEKENLLTSAVWTASIHYNTDNIHVHVATVEPQPTREMITFQDKKTEKLCTERKGSRSRKTLRAMKSAFSNQLLELQDQRIKIDELNKQMIAGIRSTEGQNRLRTFDSLLRKVAEKLPSQKGYQKYGYAERFHFKEELDQAIELYLQTDFLDVLQEINERQNFISREEEAAFGDSRTSSENKKKTLYTRLGNAILENIKQLDYAPQIRQHANISADDVKELANKFSEISEIPKKYFQSRDTVKATELEDIYGISDRAAEIQEAVFKILYSQKERKLADRMENSTENLDRKEVEPSLETIEQKVSLERATTKIFLNRKNVKTADELSAETKRHYQKIFVKQNKSIQHSIQKAQQKIDEADVSQQIKKKKRTRSLPKNQNWKKIYQNRQNEIRFRKRMFLLRRVMKMSTQQWQNERLYQQMLKNIQYLNQ